MQKLFFLLGALFHLTAPASSLIAGVPAAAGIVISKRTILTSISCVENQSALTLKVRVGSLRRTAGGTQLGVSRIIKDPEVSVGGLLAGADGPALVIVKLDIPIDGKNIAAAKLAAASESAGANVVIAGWGLTSATNTQQPATLSKTTVTVQKPSACESLVSQLLPAQEFCVAQAATQKGVTCLGDTGDGVSRNGIIYGIVGNKHGCGTASDVVIDVAKYLSFIQANKQ
ncbi:hypothetical protein TWF694_001314 [Orbilia ellipsospora]|uniref:Peptidase S1 domain-containing protein n=1 Tax=Orbilia ellipsospora TaxID=2528407 RepID=A0AAV9XRA3_9PEZI